MKQRVDRITPFTRITGPTEKARDVLPLKSINEIKEFNETLLEEEMQSQFVSKVYVLS